MNEIPIYAPIVLLHFPPWAIWTAMVCVAFFLGVGVGWLLQGPEKWRPGKGG